MCFRCMEVKDYYFSANHDITSKNFPYWSSINDDSVTKKDS